MNQRAVLDKNGPLALYCQKLEEAVITTVRNGHMTKDLALCISGGNSVDRSQYMTTTEFINKIAENFAKSMKGPIAKL